MISLPQHGQVLSWPCARSLRLLLPTPLVTLCHAMASFRSRQSRVCFFRDGRFHQLAKNAQLRYFPPSTESEPRRCRGQAVVLRSATRATAVFLPPSCSPLLPCRTPSPSPSGVHADDLMQPCCSWSSNDGLHYPGLPMAPATSSLTLPNKPGPVRPPSSCHEIPSRHPWLSTAAVQGCLRHRLPQGLDRGAI